VAGLLLGSSFFAFVFAGTLYMQGVLHYSALQTGLAWLSASVTSMTLAGLSQRLVTKVGPKVVMTIGMSPIGTGILWATQAPDASSGTSSARLWSPAPARRSPSSPSRSQR
jgi:Na+/melibiose symporter-like transporter